MRKFFSIGISELIVIPIILPFFIILFSLTNEAKLEFIISPAKNPEIKTMTIHPNLKAISIGGQMGYAYQPMWIEDQEQREIIQLLTDENGDFVAALDSSSLITHEGKHKVIVYTGITTSETPLVRSNTVEFFIDKNFNVILDPKSAKDVILLNSDMTKSEFEAEQRKYDLKIVSSVEYYPSIYKPLSYKETFYRFIILERIIYLILILFIPYALMMRWRRKKSRHESFWSLGDGIYFQHNHSFPRH